MRTFFYSNMEAYYCNMNGAHSFMDCNCMHVCASEFASNSGPYHRHCGCSLHQLSNTLPGFKNCRSTRKEVNFPTRSFNSGYSSKEQKSGGQNNELHAKFFWKFDASGQRGQQINTSNNHGIRKHAQSKTPTFPSLTDNSLLFTYNLVINCSY
ncbi:hypothetical protein O6H91_05G055100 [Diphasiastrum complanatum]|uniref:Uncharacterized protein n=1 Tax=Diphasiastrum complanatum TaxID=34168 RepID=A0ACC2DNR5_DIPCM|nr:hypothetical protein O6H91_05G055100 [Diphasiastrum complanatum]